MNTILGIAGAAAALTVVVVAVLWTALREDLLMTIQLTPSPVAAVIPAIDAAAPDRVATATFALG